VYVRTIYSFLKYKRVKKDEVDVIVRSQFPNSKRLKIKEGDTNTSKLVGVMIDDNPSQKKRSELLRLISGGSQSIYRLRNQNRMN
jgi:hypothetical protein